MTIHRFVDLFDLPVCSPPFSAFEGTSGDGDTNVYRACVGDTANLATKITSFNDGGLTTDGIHNPVLSPDGSRILFELASQTTGFREIWVVDAAAGSTATQLVADGSNYLMHPSWGPDSDTFVYVRGASGAVTGGSIEIDTVSAVGSPATLKSAAGGVSPFRPQISYDGTRVAYLWDPDDTSQGSLRVMDDDGSNDAALDTAVRYRFQGPQFSWANTGNVIAYDDGQSGVNAGYVINDDGTGKTQLNTNGDAAGAAVRISQAAWPSDDSYVVMAANVGFGFNQPTSAELDGSDTTVLNFDHGAWLQDYFRQVIVFEGRIWFIETNTKVASCLLNGTGYRVDLTINGTAMKTFATGEGWYWN